MKKKSRPSVWFNLVAGAAKYLIGRDASIAEQKRRAAQCATCPLRQDFNEEELFERCPELKQAGFKAAPVTSWCGEPGITSGQTCGCPVLAQSAPGDSAWAGERVDVTIGGVPMRAAGKSEKARSRCSNWMNGGEECRKSR